MMSVREGEPRYLVNLVDYLDTGLFLDHRPLRLMFARTPHARLLNLFCYTASVSVAAAWAGASTTSVDLSSTYLDWARENFKINELSLDRHRFVRADARVFLAEGPGGEALYDAIFLDPPTFSNSKKMKGSFDVQRDHGVLIDHALRFLAPGGTLYFSTNRRRFHLDERFGRRPGMAVTDCTESTIPEDFRDRKIHRCFRFVHAGALPRT
jgi:23S rRNA (guanine2445-N2)-methyltransferase / 23S rRNA (guanine2069-N7)-methyltransferase